jgi:hypothetical protein
LPDFGKRSSLYFNPGNNVVRIGKVVRQATVKFRLLRFSQRWGGTTAGDAIPDGFNQFDLLVNVEYTRLLQELSVHDLDSKWWQCGNTSAHRLAYKFLQTRRTALKEFYSSAKKYL